MFELLKEQPAAVRRNFKLDLLSGLFCGVLTGGLNAFILVQARRLGASEFAVSFLAAIQFVWMLFSPLWSRLFGARNPFKMVFLFDGLGRAFLLLLLFNTSPMWYILLFSLYYLMTSISGNVYCNAVNLAYPTNVRGTLMGWVRVGISLVAIFSAGMAGFLLPRWGVQRFFPLIAVFGVASAASFGQLKAFYGNDSSVQVQSGSNVGTGPPKTAFEVWKEDSRFRRFMGAYFIFGFANLMALPVFALFQVDILKVSDGFVAVLALITSVSSLIFYFIGGRFIDQVSPLNLTIYLLALSPLIPVIYFLSHSPTPLLLMALIQGITNAGFDLAILNNIIHFAGEREVGPYMAIHMNLQGIRGTIGPLLATPLVSLLGYRGFFLLVALMFLAAFWQGWSLLKTERKRRDKLMGNPATEQSGNSA